MKGLITLLVLFLSGVSYSQTRKDIIPNNIDINYLNSLVLQICNERTKDSSVFKTSNSTTFKCAEYQSSYMSKYSVCTHNNVNTHKGVVLSSITDRKKYFDKNGQLLSIAEICTFSPLEKMTYEDLANRIIDNFFLSEPHKKTIFNNYDYGSFSCSLGTYKGQTGVYVTGFFSR
jgi:hypothetical protein